MFDLDRMSSRDLSLLCAHLRRDAELTQVELAEEMGTNNTQILRCENWGKYNEGPALDNWRLRIIEHLADVTFDRVTYFKIKEVEMEPEYIDEVY